MKNQEPKNADTWRRWGNWTSMHVSHAIRFGVKLLFRSFFDPIVFTSFFAPMIIVFALDRASGQFARFAEQDPAFALLTDIKLSGVVDYILQYYTALLGWTFWLFKAVPNVVIPFANRFDHTGRANPNDAVQNEDGHEDGPLGEFLYILFGIPLFCFALFLILGKGGEMALVKAYMQQPYKLGELHWPLATRLLWLRAWTGVMGIWLTFLTDRRNGAG